jgi:hypothetical protein
MLKYYVNKWISNRVDTWSELEGEIRNLYLKIENSTEKELFWEDNGPGSLLIWLIDSSREELEKELEINKEESGRKEDFSHKAWVKRWQQAQYLAEKYDEKFKDMGLADLMDILVDEMDDRATDYEDCKFLLELGIRNHLRMLMDETNDSIEEMKEILSWKIIEDTEYAMVVKAIKEG